jgi:enoyl-CoA hydratase/carnithine racemase
VTSGDELLSERVDGVVQLTLHRPDRLNALDDALFDLLVANTAQLAEDRSVRAVIITGSGGGFCAGLDLSQFRAMAAEAEAGERPYATPGEAGNGRRQPGRGQRIVQALRRMPAPVIAAIHGAAIGGGCQLALGADIRLVTAEAKIALREMDYGITPDMGGTQLLPRLIGADRALELILTGKIISGTEAVALGMATRVCDDPLAEAWVLAREIADRSPDAVAGAKALVRLSDSGSVEAGLAAELQFMSRNIGCANQVEAVNARFAKRRPQFDDRSVDPPGVGF